MSESDQKQAPLNPDDLFEDDESELFDKIAETAGQSGDQPQAVDPDLHEEGLHA